MGRHFGESIFAARALPVQAGRLADVGSGAGFPGLPLRIAFPALHVTLVESNLKKCAFLREVKGSLALTGVEVVRCPYEELAAPQSFDFICSRALGNYRRLLQWSKVAIKPTGHMILFGWGWKIRSR